MAIRRVSGNTTPFLYIWGMKMEKFGTLACAWVVGLFGAELMPDEVFHTIGNDNIRYNFSIAGMWGMFCFLGLIVSAVVCAFMKDDEPCYKDFLND